jgi:hypothetical protein
MGRPDWQQSSAIVTEAQLQLLSLHLEGELLGDPTPAHEVYDVIVIQPPQGTLAEVLTGFVDLDADVDVGGSGYASLEVMAWDEWEPITEPGVFSWGSIGTLIDVHFDEDGGNVHWASRELKVTLGAGGSVIPTTAEALNGLMDRITFSYDNPLGFAMTNLYEVVAPEDGELDVTLDLLVRLREVG